MDHLGVKLLFFVVFINENWCESVSISLLSLRSSAIIWNVTLITFLQAESAEKKNLITFPIMHFACTMRLLANHNVFHHSHVLKVIYDDMGDETHTTQQAVRGEACRLHSRSQMYKHTYVASNINGLKKVEKTILDLAPDLHQNVMDFSIACVTSFHIVLC